MIEQIYDMIREDLIENQGDLLNLEHYYTHKHRSQDRLIDINVGMFLNDNYQQVVQIYVADKHTRIREQFIMKNNQIADSNLIIKRYA